MNTTLGLHFPGGWKCLWALVKELSRVAHLRGSLSKPRGSWGQLSISPVERLRAICHNSNSTPVPSLWHSKESVIILYLVQTSSHRGFPGGSDGKESSYNSGELGLNPGLGRFPGEENVNPLQYSCLGNPVDRGAWRAAVHRVTKSWT